MWEGNAFDLLACAPCKPLLSFTFEGLGMTADISFPSLKSETSSSSLAGTQHVVPCPHRMCWEDVTSAVLRASHYDSNTKGGTNNKRKMNIISWGQTDQKSIRRRICGLLTGYGPREASWSANHLPAEARRMEQSSSVGVLVLAFVLVLRGIRRTCMTC